MRRYLVIRDAVLVDASTPKAAASKVRRGRGDPQQLHVADGSALVVAASRGTAHNPDGTAHVDPDQLTIEDVTT